MLPCDSGVFLVSCRVCFVLSILYQIVCVACILCRLNIMSLKERINLMGTQYLQVSDDAWTAKMG
jgi:hypothetical protein